MANTGKTHVNLTEAQAEDLRATSSGLLDRYVTLVQGDCGNASDAVMTSLHGAIDGLIREAQQRLDKLGQMRPAEIVLQTALVLADHAGSSLRNPPARVRSICLHALAAKMVETAGTRP